MPLRIGAFLYRKKGLSPQEFRDYYENKHIPLLKEILGDLFPKVHRRHYPLKAGGGTTPTIVGNAEMFEFDAFAESEFDNDEHSRKFLDKLKQERERIAADESNFLDRSKLSVAPFLPTCETKQSNA